MSSCTCAFAEGGLDEALSFIHVHYSKGGAVSTDTNIFMPRKYLYLHGYRGKCGINLDFQIVASMDIMIFYGH